MTDLNAIIPMISHQVLADMKEFLSPEIQNFSAQINNLNQVALAHTAQLISLETNLRNDLYAVQEGLLTRIDSASDESTQNINHSWVGLKSEMNEIGRSLSLDVTRDVGEKVTYLRQECEKACNILEERLRSTIITNQTTGREELQATANRLKADLEATMKKLSADIDFLRKSIKTVDGCFRQVMDHIARIETTVEKTKCRCVKGDDIEMSSGVQMTAT